MVREALTTLALAVLVPALSARLSILMPMRLWISFFRDRNHTRGYLNLGRRDFHHKRACNCQI